MDEALRLDEGTPVRCVDGHMGVVIRWHVDRQSVGVQVYHGNEAEDAIREIPVAALMDLGGGAIAELAP